MMSDMAMASPARACTGAARVPKMGAVITKRADARQHQHERAELVQQEGFEQRHGDGAVTASYIVLGMFVISCSV